MTNLNTEAMPNSSAEETQHSDASETHAEELVEKQPSPLEPDIKTTGKTNDSFDAEKALEHTQSQLETLKIALDNGQLKQSISLFEQCQSRLKKLDEINYEPTIRKKFKKKLNTFQFEIQQLKKWRHWSMNQAREKLIDQLIALKSSQDHPRELHVRLKEIQEQWNKWNKSGDFPNHKLREKFSTAYKEAFKPCKDFFKEQKKQRKQNKKLRKNICRDLEVLLEATDWSHNPEWRSIGDTLRQARKEWKAAVPLNKKDWDSTNARFDHVMDKFQPHLEREREKGVQFRQDLIRQANALDADSIIVAIEKAKALQNQWNSVTIRTRKKQENQLWEQFKNACDRQFQRRADVRKEKDRQRQESKAQQRVLLNELKSINQVSVSEIKNSASRAADIQQRFQQMDGAARGKKSVLDTEFNNEVVKFRKLMKQADRLETERLFSTLEQKAEICNTLESCGRTDDVETIIAENQNKWNTIAETCGDHESVIQTRFTAACQRLQDGTTNDQSDGEQTERNYEIKSQICLQLEVLAELDSPPEFARERLRFNVERLNAVMTKQTEQVDLEKDVNALLIQFWSTGAVPEQSRQTMNDRFQRIRAALRKD